MRLSDQANGGHQAETSVSPVISGRATGGALFSYKIYSHDEKHSSWAEFEKIKGMYSCYYGK